jgi:hypothetical protein
VIDNKVLNEHCGFLYCIMNDSMYPGKDYYEYASLFKSRDKECSTWYDLAKNMDFLKHEHNYIFEPEWKEFPEEFNKVDKEHFLYKHFELTHSTYVELYNKIKNHLLTQDQERDYVIGNLEWLDYFKTTLTVEGMFNFLSSGVYNYKLTQDKLHEVGDIPF